MMKKISQNDLRRFMTAHKKKALTSTKKIESPLAKYLFDGTLSCIVCGAPVKSEAVWAVHINSKQHRENIARKSQPAAPLTSEVPPSISKRPLEPTEEKKPKKLKSILKNAPPVPVGFFDGDNRGTEVANLERGAGVTKEVSETSQADGGEAGDAERMEVDEPREAEVEESKEAELPEGFFDDPILDAKARNVEYKDPVEEEWEKFQKEIKEAEEKSAEIIHLESEDATVQRQVDHIDEQISRLSRVVQLQKKTEEVKAKCHTEIEIKKEDLSSDEDDTDLDIEFDWRAKSYLS